MWQDELDPLDYGLLFSSYLRRTRFESRVLAVEIIKALGESMSDGKQRVSPDTMMAMLGGL